MPTFSIILKLIRVLVHFQNLISSYRNSFLLGFSLEILIHHRNPMIYSFSVGPGIEKPLNTITKAQIHS